MKQNSVLRLLTTVLLFSIVLSCTDHLPPDPLPNNQRIKSITQIVPGNEEMTFISYFTYVSANQLKQVDSGPVPNNLPGTRGTTTYGYGPSNEIKQVQRTLAPFVGEIYFYNIDATGLNKQLSDF